MHPDNAPCLTAAAIDCCVLANNHVLDWGYAGFEETLATLEQNAIAGAGAGFDRKAAQAPGILPVGGHGRVLVFAAGLRSSGIPPRWAATRERPGVHLLPDLSEQSVGEIAAAVRAARRPGDIVVVSLHWGGNWGYDIPMEHGRFARALIDAAGIDLIHGHSSHHPLGIEVYRGRPILYGCGDLIDDYEGISGHEAYRSDLALLYLVTLDRSSGELRRLELVPMQRRLFRLRHPTAADSDWLRARLDRECRRLGSRVVAEEDASGARLELHWG
jgi:poly-gamma-glutamate synthesis protein (capsule biosynthesis protein)